MRRSSAAPARSNSCSRRSTAGAHVVLEGPARHRQATLLRAVAAARTCRSCFVEGNAELTPARLVGHFDPARVLAEGYQPEIFVDGPLVDGAAHAAGCSTSRSSTGCPRRRSTS